MSRKTVKDEALPEGWQEMKLGEVCKVITSPVDKKTIVGELPVKLCNYTDVYYNNIIDSTINFMIATAKSQEKEKFSILKGDVIITKDSETPDDIGVPAYVKETVDNLLCGYHLAILRSNKEVMGKYIYYTLMSSRVKNDFYKFANGITRFGLTKESYQKIKIPIPPLQEQKAIASLLEKWDTAIEKTESLIAAKEKQFKWLLKTLINDQQNNPDWQKVKLGEVFNLGRGRVISKKEIQNNLGNFPVYSSQTSNNGELGKISTYDLEGDYITWTTDGANAGTVFYRTGKFNCTNVCGTAKPINPDEVNCQFVSYFLHNKTKKHVSYVGNPKLMNNVFSKIPIALAPPSQQKQIYRTLNTAKHEINLLEMLAKKYRSQKHGLMQKLLTGQWRVKS